MNSLETKYRNILEEVKNKVISRKNYKSEFILGINPDSCKLEVVIDSHDVGEPMFTMVRISGYHDGKDFLFVGFSKRHRTDREYNPELGFRIALHRALTSLVQWTSDSK